MDSDFRKVCCRDWNCFLGTFLELVPSKIAKNVRSFLNCKEITKHYFSNYCSDEGVHNK